MRKKLYLYIYFNKIRWLGYAAPWMHAGVDYSKKNWLNRLYYPARYLLTCGNENSQNREEPDTEVKSHLVAPWRAFQSLLLHRDYGLWMPPGSWSERKRIFVVTGLATLMNSSKAHITVEKFSRAKEGATLTRPLSQRRYIHPPQE